MTSEQEEIIARLRNDIAGWEGFRPLPPEEQQKFGLRPIDPSSGQ